MARQVCRVAWLFAIIAIATGVSWAAQLGAEDDIPRFLRPSGHVTDHASAETRAKQLPFAAQRLREGATLSSIVGSFEDVGERIAFHPDDGQGPFLVLENLMLERVERLREETGDRAWIVSGVLTEYGGHNHLLLKRAIVATDRPENAPKATGATVEPS